MSPDNRDRIIFTTSRRYGRTVSVASYAIMGGSHYHDSIMDVLKSMANDDSSPSKVLIISGDWPDRDSSTHVRSAKVISRFHDVKPKLIKPSHARQLFIPPHVRDYSFKGVRAAHRSKVMRFTFIPRNDHRVNKRKSYIKQLKRRL